MEFLPSPNFGPRRDGAKIRHLILHYTGKVSTKEFISHMLDPKIELSAHYVIDYDGRMTQLVDEANRAWHAGKSFWAGETDINSSSIGIEIANPGHEFGYVPFRPEQISATIKLCREILSRHDILPQHVLAHSDIAPLRKQDPGELFPWAELAKNGVGLFPNIPLPQSKAMGERLGEGAIYGISPSPSLFPASRGEELETYGYDIFDLPAAITAFQRHFRPEKISDAWDDECGARLAALLAMRQRV